MDILQWLWGQLSYIVALLVGTALVALQMPKRDHFQVRAITACLVTAGLKMLLDLLLINGKSYDMIVTVNLCLSLMLYLLLTVGVMFCFHCDLFAGLFCATIGYSLQHISQRLSMIWGYADSSLTLLARMVILIPITVLVYVYAYRVELSRNRYCNIVVDNQMQLLISTLFIMTTIFLDQFVLNAADSFMTRLQIIIMSCSSCVLGILVEISSMSSKSIELEKDFETRLLSEEKEKLLYDKAVIEMLNVKAHDLKHQLTAQDGLVSAQAKDEIEESIEAYDNLVVTGNDALDAVLTRKSRLAAEKGIRITCLADGKKLSFMSDIDIYSLFGNILDNAMEAAEKLEQPDKKIISITVETKGYFLMVSESNYYVGNLEMNEGIPRTTKADRLYHGFGMRSIQLLTSKYNGDISIQTKEDRFILDIMFPI